MGHDSIVTTTFDELLNAYWLRPETALWRELDIRAMQAFEFKSPSLDIGCGDGLFSFIRAGGRMSETYDAFRSVSNLDDYFKNIDVYDAFEEASSFKVLSRPNYQINIGFDHKENLLKKTRVLGLYKASKLGDANAPLPFEDNAFNSIFSNIVYWLDEPSLVIAELGRVLRPGVMVCLLLPNRTFPEYSFYNQLYVKTENPKWAFLQKLDRGRFSDNIKQSRSAAEWERMFLDAGLRVAEHRRHLSKATIQVWDVGLRPLFPLLKKITDAIPPEEFLEIKAEWVDIVRMFLGPLLDLDGEVDAQSEHAFHCYILEK